MTKKITRVFILMMASMFLWGNTASFAESQWAKNHPRRHQVNTRLNRQNRRIHSEVKEGDVNRVQARQLHREDHQIRGEERAMARRNGGYITRQEQGMINHQENAVSHQIGQ